MYIAEEAFKKAGVQANIQYHTALPGMHTQFKLINQVLLWIVSQFCLVWRSMLMHFGRWLRAGNVNQFNHLMPPDTKMLATTFDLTQGHQCESEAQSDWGEAGIKRSRFPAPGHTRDGLNQIQRNGFYKSIEQLGDSALWPAPRHPSNEHPGPSQLQRQPCGCCRLPWRQQGNSAT